jgi:geranylgeranyl reductase family protein
LRAIETAFDVIIVGAGPVGSLLAEELARLSLRVALLEEHPEIGLPDHCSGLVSPRTLVEAGVAEESLQLARYTDARVWSPSGEVLWLRSGVVQAVAIDRTRFDQALADRAVSAGAHLMLNTRATHFARSDDGVNVRVRQGAEMLTLRAAVLVGADGASSSVRRWMGTDRRHEIIPAIKANVLFRGTGTSNIEILVGHGIAPGWFAWIIPLPDGTARVGMGATRSPRQRWEAFLDLVRERFGEFEILEIRKAPLPLGPAREFVGDRVMLVGAAARQTKPTTGGGIYFGVRAAKLAAQYAAQALAQGDCSYRFLTAYEHAWHRVEGRELVFGHWLRQGFRHLSDVGFDAIIGLLNRRRLRRWVSRLGDMDYPSRMAVSLFDATRKTNSGQRAAEHDPLVRVRA